MDTHNNKEKSKSKKESPVYFLACTIFYRPNVEYCTTTYQIPFLIWKIPSHHKGFCVTN